jgi:dolichyl-phosphate-mannose--protein O-mannosyl transferase
MHLTKVMSSKWSALVFLVIVGGLLHFTWLNHPDSVVFDEVHFGGFSTSYCCSGKYFFDIHPPHGKLIIAGFAKLLGYQGLDDFASINNSYSPEAAVALRSAPALAGTLIPLVIFVLIGQLGGSPGTAFLGAVLFLLDNALLLQTRIIVLDGFLVLFTFSCLSCFLGAMRQTTLHGRLLLFALAGILAACAVGTKFTGLVALGLVGVIALVDLAKTFSLAHLSGWLIAGLCFLVPCVLIYCIGWELHFRLLTEPGPGDIWGKLSGDYITDFLDLHQKMFSANTGLSHTHPDASPWWSWPWMVTPIFYWAENQNWIYLIGNPVLWWLISVLFIVAIVTSLLRKISDLGVHSDEETQHYLLWIPLLGYIASFMPMAAVSRVLFLYHYYTPLVFSSLFVVLWLESIGAIRRRGITNQRWSYYAFLALLLAGFVIISPMTYGIMGDSPVKEAIFRILPGWR